VNKLINVLFVIRNLNAGGAERVFLNIINNLDLKKFSIKIVLLKP